MSPASRSKLPFVPVRRGSRGPLKRLVLGRVGSVSLRHACGGNVPPEMTSARHRSASRGGSLARVGAGPAVDGLVFAAFHGTGIADGRAERAQLPGKSAIALHQGDGQSANIGAVSIKSDAVGHHRDLVLAQTGVGAMFAGGRTVVACIDTLRKLLVAHRDLQVCGSLRMCKWRASRERSRVVDARVRGRYKRAPRSRSAFPMTDTELNAIAALAIIGLRSSPIIGYAMPAAIGTPSVL